MRIALLLILLLLIPPLSAADKAGPIRGDWKADQVADGVYVIHGPLGYPTVENQGFMNNPGFIVTDDGVVVIDPGGSVQVGELLLSRIREITDQPVVAVFDSHIHGDHWLGNQAIAESFANAKLYGHPRMIAKVKTGAGDAWIAMANELTGGALAGSTVVNANTPADQGDEFVVGGVTFRIIHNDHAHTDTDIMVHVVERGVVFLGDNCANQRILRLDHGSLAGNIQALDLAMETGAKTFVPGHGLSGGLSVPQSYKDYLATIYDNTKAGYEEGLSDFEIKPLVLPALTQWQDWDGFDDQVGKHVNDAYREIEAASF
ncbi:MAG: MBL fold metallo-hydrolase [Chromatiales bacterium]|nr:MBL fold metallo-hydrolase [Chromatiales bacterium]